MSDDYTNDIILYYDPMEQQFEPVENNMEEQEEEYDEYEKTEQQKDDISIDTLVELLNELETLPIELLDSNNSDKVNDLIIDIRNIAEELLITDNGFCNWSNIKMLRFEYLVEPYDLDEDNNWVLGAIRTSKGDIIYG